MTTDKEYEEAARKFALWVCEVMIDTGFTYCHKMPNAPDDYHQIASTFADDNLDRLRGIVITIPTARNDEFAVAVMCHWPSPTKEYYTSNTFGPDAIDCVLIAVNWLASTRWPGAEGKPIEPPTPQEEWNR